MIKDCILHWHIPENYFSFYILLSHLHIIMNGHGTDLGAWFVRKLDVFVRLLEKTMISKFTHLTVVSWHTTAQKLQIMQRYLPRV